MLTETPDTATTIMRRVTPAPDPAGTQGAPAPKVLGIAGHDTGTPARVVTYPWYALILIRVARAYVVSLVGLLSLDGLDMIELGDDTAAGWWQILQCMWAATIPAFYSFLMNLSEILTNLDIKHPLLRG